MFDIDDLNFNNLDERLQHLDKQQVLDLIKRYYDNEKINDLLKEYKIKTTNSNLIRILPGVWSSDLCEYCEERFVIPLSPKSDNNSLDEGNKTCSNCNHNPNSYFCDCVNCKEKREKERLEEIERQDRLDQEKQEYLNNFLSEDNWVKVQEDELDVEDRLYLAVILKGALSENTMYLEPLKDVANNLAPTKEFEVELIKTLTGKDLIIPHKISDINNFEIEFKDEERQSASVSHGIYEVSYRINIEPMDLDYDEMIKRLMYPSPELFSNEFCYEMWKKISFYESMQYLLYQMNEVGYSFNPGKKTYAVLEQLLESFSVSQVYNIIFRAVANSTTRYQSGKITKIHAQNSVIASCEMQGQRAIAENWELKGYNRIRELPESLLSQVLFNSIMQISALGFYEKPTKDL
ncbi:MULTISPECIES: hypothetical protein [Staphylococcus]|nr:MULTISPECIES: hypothetical protein [Staphylococcus]MBF2182794.1 hypothetical protein [Staphylococcus epidermidis]MBF2191399.1 hypothetical protein [Staphylococcus epidermidis]MBF2193602.1 hypothetical protein [Staphylococcus epidermidis]MBF2196324.1 hypothetical protein [Staphylococcus epidermidis]MBF2197947.1 hypothetical protein [Staphylococcus epidermidis]